LNSQASNIKTDPKSIIFALVILSISIIGTFKNIYFMMAPLFYLAILMSIYYLGAKLKNYSLNIAYIWTMKWTMFVIALYLTGTYMLEVFIHAMFLFILINIILNPSIFTKKKAV
tara:strand:- start:1158 stop:1502 length:345 start_codon:yes stop_codon:yes gene_type:complete